MSSKQAVTAAARSAKREIGKSQREIEREYEKLGKECTKIEGQIRAASKQGNKALMNSLAKQLIRTRKQMESFAKTKSHMSSLNATAQSMKSQATMMDAVSTSAKVMANMNAQMDPIKMQMQVQQFAAASEKMQMGQDMVGEGLDSVFDDDDLELESDNLLDSILDEIGLNVSSSMKSAPMQAGKAAAAADHVDEEDDDLAARFAALAK